MLHYHLERATAVWIIDEIDSSNREVFRLLGGAGEKDLTQISPFWLLARRQTAGRGRRGRSWVSAEGNLMASHAAIWNWPASELALLGYVLSLACYQAVGKLLPKAAELALKWPNDVVISEAKLAGLLIETQNLGKDHQAVAAGIGVNITHAPMLADRQTCCLADWMGKPPNAEALLSEIDKGWRGLLEEIMRCRAEVKKAETRSWFAQEIRQKWLQAAQGLRKDCQILQADGSILAGIFTGLAEDGALQLRLETGEVRHIYAGEASFCPISSKK